MMLIDTNIFIYYLKNDKKVVEYFDHLKQNHEDIYFSFINKIELLSFSQLNPKEENLIKEMLNQFNYIGYDENIETKTIEIRTEFNIKIPDAIIAASSIIKNCTLVTRNESDFKIVSGLTLFNPYS